MDKAGRVDGEKLAKAMADLVKAQACQYFPQAPCGGRGGGTGGNRIFGVDSCGIYMGDWAVFTVNLPVTLGITVWTVNNGTVYEGTVESIELMKSEEMGDGFFTMKVKDSKERFYFCFSDVEKTVFLNPMKAEEAMNNA